ncbi:TIGR03943 family putative permease subunit [Cohnella massiliensis]|uniref:TIGR03943 family putative permease subunit n=1 Tax=Cohnella massiliensis TaxID=1816691 RepID=UPI0009B95ABA|nr:TIGR03943 family protein [Cohnella massiliensis]
MHARPDRAQIAHHLVRAVILAGIAFYIVRLNSLDTLTLYVAPRMTIYIKLAAFGVYALAAGQLFQAVRLLNGARPACDCGHDHEMPRSLLKSVLLYACFAVPLAIGFLTPDTTMGSAMAAKKGMNLSSSADMKEQLQPFSQGSLPEAEPTSAASAPPDSANAPGAGEENGTGNAPGTGNATGDRSPVSSESPAPEDHSGGEAGVSASSDPLDALFPYDNFSAAYAKYGKQIYGDPVITVTEKSYMEILTTVDLYLNNFIGKEMAINGFVYRDETMADHQFVIGRFAVQCCTADALPYGVMVEAEDASRFGNDSWLRVTGTIGTTEYNGMTIMKLDLTNAEEIEPIKEPYIYADLEFGLD